MIDHSLLNPTLTEEELEKGCLDAIRYDVASVCIVPYFVARCSEILSGSGVLPSTTIGFPHGVQSRSVKQAETLRALDDGAKELDAVVNVSKVRSGDWAYVSDELATLVELIHGSGAKVKIIFENCYLSDEQKIRLCRICAELDVDWVKTSTGFGSGGATVEDVRLMREHCPPHVQVKAAGGIRDLDTLLQFRQLGVTRVGASRTSDILEECRRRLGLEPIKVSEGQPRVSRREGNY
jgi:deoxyribose-phosphate aldolase